MEYLNSIGTTIYLQRSPEQILSRLSAYGREKRPMFRGKSDEELLERIGKMELMADYVASLPAPRTQVSNLELFRVYIETYMEAQPWLNKKMLHMVRHLQSSDTGVPLQIYAFSNDTAWVNYEGIQAALFEHVMAIAPLFELKIFQRPSGADLEQRGVVDEIIKDIV